jgi:hypothetical protein
VADINDRLDRLQRREEFDRFGRPLRPAAEDPVGSVVARPAGVDDRLGEVLDAVAAVVRRHPGLSVMVAIADGRTGRPVVRVTERDGSVETGVVVAGLPAGARAVAPAAADQAASVPTASVPTRPVQRETLPAYEPEPGFRSGVPAGDPVFEAGPARRYEPGYAPVARESLVAREGAMPAGDPVFEPAGRDLLPPRDPGRELVRESLPSRDAVQARGGVVNGRHAAEHEDEFGSGWSGSSWHNSLWSQDRPQPGAPRPEAARSEGAGRLESGRPESRGRPESSGRPEGAGWPESGRPESSGRPEGAGWPESGRPESGGRPEPAPGVPLNPETSQTVTRLAQLLRENPALTSSWSREAGE